MKQKRTIRVDQLTWEKVAGYLKRAGYTPGMSGIIDSYLKQVAEAFDEGFSTEMTDEEARAYLQSKLK